MCRVSIYGASVMPGKYNGLIAYFQTIAPNVKWTNLCIHSESLAVRNMLQKLKIMLDEAVNVVNFIKARPLN
jgi:hypothetical protein